MGGEKGRRKEGGDKRKDKSSKGQVKKEKTRNGDGKGKQGKRALNVVSLSY